MRISSTGARKGVRGGHGRNALLYALASVICICMLLVELNDPASLREGIESVTYDARMYLRARLGRPESTGEVIIVTIDEQSIAEHGRWPWSRSIQAELINAISAAGASVIGLDVLLTERESSSEDAALARAIAQAGNVILATAFMHEESPVATPAFLWDHAFVTVKGNKAMPWKDWLVHPRGVLAPLEELAEGASLGSVLSPPDLDGVIRHETLYLYYEEDFYPSLALMVAARHLGASMDRMVLIGGRGVALGQRMVEASTGGQVLIDYYGKEGTIPSVSASDVLAGRVPADVFAGKAVFVGTSAVATYDQKVTPLSANMPGVEKNATVVENLLADSFMRRAHPAMEMLLTLVCGLLVALPLIHLMALRGSLLSLGVMVAFIVLATGLFIFSALWVVMLYPLMNMAGIASILLASRYFLEEKRARKIRRMFSSYVSPRVVTALIENPRMARLGGENKVVTVLFSDICGFTSMSEGMRPEEIVAHLNEYFMVMTDVIFHWGGTFDKIVGDEIMAFWGAPLEQPDHAELAARCALDMFGKLDRLHEKWRKEGKPLINIGIGLNTGEVLVGNIGAEDKKIDYTIMGDHVNAGARVEALTRKFEARILMTEFTADEIRPIIEAGRFGHLELKWRGTTKVKGKEHELSIFELLETRPGD